MIIVLIGKAGGFSRVGAIVLIIWHRMFGCYFAAQLVEPIDTHVYHPFRLAEIIRTNQITTVLSLTVSLQHAVSVLHHDNVTL